MVVYASGPPPALTRTAPWQDGPYAAAIRASIAHWHPTGRADWTLSPDASPGPAP
ncbi:hypothetical protein ACX27O_15405 [Micromonospora sp. SD19]